MATLKRKQATAIVDRCATRPEFDYSVLAPTVAETARSTAERIKRRLRASILDTGRDLLAMKEQLEHGRFEEWIECEFGMTPRSAQNYMQAARVFGDKSEIVSQLPQSLVYQLAAPATPAPVREEIVRRFESGEHIHTSEVERAIRNARNSVARTDSRQRIRKSDGEKRLAFLAKLPEEERARLLKREHREELRRKQRQAEREADLRKHHEELVARDSAASEAIEMVRAALGAEFSTFIQLAQRADWSFREWIENDGKKPERREGWSPAMLVLAP